LSESINKRRHVFSLPEGLFVAQQEVKAMEYGQTHHRGEYREVRGGNDILRADGDDVVIYAAGHYLSSG
jgi:hypothetical protein